MYTLMLMQCMSILVYNGEYCIPVVCNIKKENPSGVLYILLTEKYIAEPITLEFNKILYTYKIIKYQ